MTEKYILAIDLGTGGPKAGVVDAAGRVIASANQTTTLCFLPGGGVEQDPHEWWQAVCQAARRAVRLSGILAEAIQAVSCTTQWSVVVPVDSHGEPLMNAVHWLDTRGAPYNQAITRGFPSVEGYALGKLVQWVRRTGFPPTHSGIDSLGHVLFIQHELPEIYRKTDKFLEPMDYLTLRLTGRCAGSLCTVFPFLLTDIRHPERLSYDPWLVKACGVDPKKMPELLPVDGVVGPVLPSVADELGISRQALVLVPANDNHTAAIGSGAVADYDSVLVLGNSGYLAGHVPFKKTDIMHALTTIPCPLPGKYLIMAELGNTGKVLESFLYNQLYPQDVFSLGDLPEDVFARLDDAVAGVPVGSGGVLFLPWFNGSISPSMDHLARGGFLNLSHQTRREHLSRAVLEGIAFNWRWLVEAVQPFIGRKFTHLRLAGGGAQSDAWAQIITDVLGIPIHQMAEPRLTNVRGAAYLAMDRLGWLPLESIPQRVEVARVFEPLPQNREVYNKLYQQFRASFKTLKPIFHALNRS